MIYIINISLIDIEFKSTVNEQIDPQKKDFRDKNITNVEEQAFSVTYIIMARAMKD